jgi:hypothetical protein
MSPIPEKRVEDGPGDAKDRNDRPRNDAKATRYVDRNHGLEVEIEQRLVFQSTAGIEVELKWNRNNISDGILCFLGEIFYVFTSGSGVLWLRLRITA